MSTRSPLALNNASFASCVKLFLILSSRALIPRIRWQRGLTEANSPRVLQVRRPSHIIHAARELAHIRVREHDGRQSVEVADCHIAVRLFAGPLHREGCLPGALARTVEPPI